MGCTCCRGTNEAVNFRHRAAFASKFDASIPALDEDMLSERIEEWLSPLLTGKRRLGDIRRTCDRRRAGAASRLSRQASARPSRAVAVRQSGGKSARDRLFIRCGTDRRSSCASPVRAGETSYRGQRTRGADPRNHLPRWTADPDDEGSAGILARDLARRREGHARALPQTSVARRPGIGIAHTAEQALKRFDKARSEAAVAKRPDVAPSEGPRPRSTSIGRR